MDWSAKICRAALKLQLLQIVVCQVYMEKSDLGQDILFKQFLLQYSLR